MADFENVLSACRAASSANVEIDDATARTIASMYHAGQASISYSFVTTGAIADQTDLYRECFPDYEMLESDEKEIADAFGTYLVNRPGTGPIEGWSRLWVAGQVCRHSWVAGIMHVSDKDLDTVAASRTVECEKCETTYQLA